MHLLGKAEWDRIGEITRIGTPVAVQQMIFTFISMGIARVISEWGEAAIAAQKVGSQVESLSWMAAKAFLLPSMPLLLRIMGQITGSG
mgnify:CR=1 FL=1